MQLEASTPSAGPLDFVLRPTPPAPLGKTLTEDQQAIAEAVGAFMEREVIPRTAELETGDLEVMRDLFAQAAELGLCGIEVPERYGGMELDLTTGLLVAAQLARQPSFATALGAHFGIGTLPLLIFGDEALRERYLPALAAGERIGAYALTEPDAGSDALAVRTRAVRRPDGWALSGTKQFITNAGLADLITVFAKTEEEGFTAFLVPGETPGLSAGPPEHKMGLRGSPTGQFVLDEVEIPRDHVLGELGKGHRVAFNVLNIGRLKLGFGSLGSAREALRHTARHANERHQFGHPLGRLGLVRAKLSRMAARLWALEAACLRVSTALDARIPDGLTGTPRSELLGALRDYAEAGAMIKVLGSEVAGEVLDDAVQIHGGYGFSEEYAVCRLYRDIRVNRIFEGANEVNRLLAAGGILKRGFTGGLALPALFSESAGPAPGAAPGAGALAADLRWAFGRLAGAATMRFGLALQEEQQVLADLSDLAIELLALDCAAGRAEIATDALAPALLAVITEEARERIQGPLLRLGARLDADPAELVAPFARGTADVTGERDAVAAAVLERGDLP